MTGPSNDDIGPPGDGQIDQLRRAIAAHCVRGAQCFSAIIRATDEVQSDFFLSNNRETLNEILALASLHLAMTGALKECLTLDEAVRRVETSEAWLDLTAIYGWNRRRIVSSSLQPPPLET